MVFPGEQGIYLENDIRPPILFYKLGKFFLQVSCAVSNNVRYPPLQTLTEITEIFTGIFSKSNSEQIVNGKVKMLHKGLHGSDGSARKDIAELRLHDETIGECLVPFG